MRLTDDETQALHVALEDEHRAWATYTQVLHDFGDIRPFSNIREAEARHIDALETLFERYGLEAPPNEWVGRAPRFDSIEAACQAGVDHEIDNEKMYERLMASTERRDILEVFERLRGASRDRHLRAFQRCLGRGGGPGGGQGCGGGGRGGLGRRG